MPLRRLRRSRERLLTFRDAHGRRVRYTLRLPHRRSAAHPLVVSLHFGWETGGAVPRGFGARLLDDLVEPALRDLDAIVVAPDCPGQDWTDPVSERAVLDLVEHVQAHHPVDRSRRVVAGYSLGAAGGWHLLRRHPDLFSAAIVVAGTPPPPVGDAPALPAVFAINSRADAASSLDATSAAIDELRRKGADAEMVVLENVSHLETRQFADAMAGAVPWLESIWRKASAAGSRPEAAGPPLPVARRPSGGRHAETTRRVSDARSRFTRAQDLLVLCARTTLSPALEARVAALAATDVDWDALFKVAERQGSALLLYVHLNRLARGSVPRDVLERQQSAFHASYLRSGLMSHELIRLCRLFEARGIAAIPFKGPILAASVYGDIALRRSVDLDLVVPADAVRRAASLLIEDGYRFAVESEADFEDRYHGFVHDGLSVRVELQPAMGNLDFWFPLDTRDHWRALEPVTLGDATLLTFAPADLLVVLAVHGCKHGWSRLMWVVDVAEFLRAHADADWPRMLDHARSRGAFRMVAVALALARDLLDAPMPHAALNAAADAPSVQRLAATMAAHLFAEVPFTRFELLQLYLDMKDGWVDRAKFYLHCSGVDLDPALEESASGSFLVAYHALVRARKLVKLGLPIQTRETILQWLKQV